jgi:hypothetical protein
MMTSKTEGPSTTAIVLGLIATVIALALGFSARFITTNVGYETVLVSQPILGDYKVLPHPLKPGRSLELKTVRGIPVKTDKMDFYYRYSDYSGKGGDTIQAKMVVKSKDSVALITRFGEFWYTDYVEDVFGQAVADTAREYYKGAQADSRIFQTDFNGRLRAVIQQKFNSAGIPLAVFVASGEYSPIRGSSTNSYVRKEHQLTGQGVRYEE